MNSQASPRKELYTTLVSGLLFPLHERLKKHQTLALRRQMEISQWWRAEQLQDLQLARLKRLLTHAQQHVPYYRELFARLGFQAEQVSSLKDLQALPFLNKAEIRGNTEALKSELASGLARFNTGGSSGEPLIFFIGKERVSHDVAAKWRATRWWDVDIGDREIVVWGSPIELTGQDRVKQVRDALMRTELLPAFEMSDAKLDVFVQRLMVEAYGVAVFQLARASAGLAGRAQAHRTAGAHLGLQGQDEAADGGDHRLVAFGHGGCHAFF